jgi:hypothetical protein
MGMSGGELVYSIFCMLLIAGLGKVSGFGVLKLG